MNNFIPIILAGGQGKRMKSSLPKTLQKILDKPMIFFLINALRNSNMKEMVFVVAAENKNELIDYLSSIKKEDETFYFPVQKAPLGTGDAVATGLHALENRNKENVIIFYGDMPCVSSKLIKKITNKNKNSDLLLVSAKVANPEGYGRIVRDQNSEFEGIVEHKDALKTPNLLKIDEINTGISTGSVMLLQKLCSELTNNNAQGEYYFTDVFKKAKEQGMKVDVIKWLSENDIIGVNTRVELNKAEQIIKKRILNSHRLNGVTIHSDNVFISPEVKIGQDTEIFSGVHLSGDTLIGQRVTVETGAIIENCVIDNDCHILPYSVLENSVVKNNVQIGPFSHLRPGSVIDSHAKVGNFVETKKTYLGKGTKANHLSYIGDSEVGQNVNIGAGTITCNYDGWHKYKTVIEDQVLIGSDTQLVAPVRVGKKAVVAAGTTVVKNVNAGELCISRAKQENIPGYRKKKEAKEQNNT